MLECWSVGVLECWSVGVLECWSVGVLECWSAAPSRNCTRVAVGDAERVEEDLLRMAGLIHVRSRRSAPTVPTGSVKTNPVSSPKK
jgi:hypothetical protein